MGLKQQTQTIHHPDTTLRRRAQALSIGRWCCDGLSIGTLYCFCVLL
jgi:hypothetical protein